MQLHWAILHEPKLDELPERALDLADQAAAGHRRHDVPRKLPAALLRDLEGYGFRALAIEGAQVHVHEARAVAIGKLRARDGLKVLTADDRMVNAFAGLNRTASLSDLK